MQSLGARLWHALREFQLPHLPACDCGHISSVSRLRFLIENVRIRELDSTVACGREERRQQESVAAAAVVGCVPGTRHATCGR